MARSLLRTLMPVGFASGSVTAPPHIFRSCAAFFRCRFSTESVASSDSKLYAVQLIPDKKEYASLEEVERFYHSFLSDGKKSGGSDKDPRIECVFNPPFPVFIARLSPDEVKALEKKDGFVCARALQPRISRLTRNYRALCAERARKYNLKLPTKIIGEDGRVIGGYFNSKVNMKPPTVFEGDYDDDGTW